jgi:glycosyltransferase involved in cell wall biosynthesis
MNILIYFPYNLRTVEQQSVMEMLVSEGHKVVLLTTCERGYLHEYVEQKGVIAEWINTNEIKGKADFYTVNLKKLKSVLKKYRIDVVIAHQQATALIAGLLRMVQKFPLIYVRHNTDEDYQLNAARAKWYNRLINLITPVKVAPSSVVERFWIEKEAISPKQIHRINYGYNFGQYEAPVQERVESIKEAFPTSLRILSMARLVPSKRHEIMFSVIKQLTDEGVDCKFLCLGIGPLEKELREKIIAGGMQERIFLLGRKDNVFDYIEACDVFMHLSSTEASNSAVKEVALCKKSVLVREGVGDFDDYIRSDFNGFLLNKNSPKERAVAILMAISKNEIDKKKIGDQLFETVIDSFDIKKAIPRYEELLNRLAKS